MGNCGAYFTRVVRTMMEKSMGAKVVLYLN